MMIIVVMQVHVISKIYILMPNKTLFPEDVACNYE